ncbi:hypothetical protein EDB83DRAFT_2502708 [Lactarius deliciosus]|nr:hypothetical protein EDB83DRAFT_2502708 [Lactarius deliciosus]
MSINVKWGRERLQIPLPPPDTKLSVLRQSLSEHTRLPPHAFKLIYAGAVMKDDNAPRESFLPTKHVTSVLFSRSTPDPRRRSPPRPKHQPLRIYARKVAAVRNTLEPGVDAFLRTPTVDTQWLEARRERKGAVRTVQGVLDRLDNGWREAKEQSQIQTRAGSQR